MSAPTPPVGAAVIAAEPGSRLESLAEAYAVAKPAADAAKARLDTITDAIKLHLTTAAPGVERVDLNAPGLDRPLRMTAVTSWGLDTALLKTELPEVYVRYARQKSYWVLKAVGRPVTPQ